MGTDQTRGGTVRCRPVTGRWSPCSQPWRGISPDQGFDVWSGEGIEPALSAWEQPVLFSPVNPDSGADLHLRFAASQVFRTQSTGRFPARSRRGLARCRIVPLHPMLGQASTIRPAGRLQHLPPDSYIRCGRVGCGGPGDPWAASVRGCRRTAGGRRRRVPASGGSRWRGCRPFAGRAGPSAA